MSYDEEQQRRSRVVVETPAARGEVVREVSARVPERRGMSTGAVAALVLGAVALTTLLFLFLMKGRDDTAATTAPTTTASTTTTTTTQPTPLAQQPPVVQQPLPPTTTTTTTQPPIIVQQPATAPPPIVITEPRSTTAPPTTAPDATRTTAARTAGPDDATLQASIDKRLAEDQTLGSLGVVATVVGDKITLTGTVESQDLKRRVEAAVRRVEGVRTRTIDNQISVGPE